jgi:hypothetical protein
MTGVKPELPPQADKIEAKTKVVQSTKKDLKVCIIIRVYLQRARWQ